MDEKALESGTVLKRLSGHRETRGTYGASADGLGRGENPNGIRSERNGRRGQGMDKELQTAPADSEGSLETEHGDNSSPDTRKPGRRQKKREEPPDPLTLVCRTVRHFFPGLNASLNALPDPRDDKRCVYSQSHLIWLGLLMFLEHLGSRRQIRNERGTDAFLENFAVLCGGPDVGTVADPDTLAYYAELLDPDPLEELRADMLRRLIRMKILDQYRIENCIPVAVDGTQLFTFDYEPWEACCHRKVGKNGETQYFSYALDAKVVTPNGMALTIATEMLTNEGHDEFDKQDCELKAFPRIASRIKAAFPRTPFVFLLDGLYASQNVIRLIEDNGWRYIITFKEGSMPERYAESETLRKLQRRNRLISEKDGVSQTFSWTKGLPVAEFTPDVIYCEETEGGTDECKRFVWLTDFNVNCANVVNLSNNGGRLRWKIENEGFRVQKKNGYEMEHAYSRHENGMRIMYILLTIAHMISQLVAKGSLLRSLVKTFGSAKNFARRLAESIRYVRLDADMIATPCQIRFSGVPAPP